MGVDDVVAVEGLEPPPELGDVLVDRALRQLRGRTRGEQPHPDPVVHVGDGRGLRVGAAGQQVDPVPAPGERLGEGELDDVHPAGVARARARDR